MKLIQFLCVYNEDDWMCLTHAYVFQVLRKL